MGSSDEQARVRRTRSGVRACDARARRVAVVDDDGVLQAVVRRLLTSRGFDVMCASDGVAAMAMFRRQLPDLVITDVDMPMLGGIALAWLLDAQYGADSPPVIMWTGNGDVGTVSKNVRHVLTKGAPGELIEAIEAVFATAESASG